MLFYHPALPLPNHNTQYFENLYHSPSLLDLMTLMQMVLDSYVFDIICTRYAMSVHILQKIHTLHTTTSIIDLPQEPLAV